MAGLNLVYVQDLIAAYVRQEFPNYEVYEDDVIDDDAVLKMSNQVKPYIVLKWGGLSRDTANTSFAGVRFDEYNSSVDVMVVAPTGKKARLSLNIILDKLIGWKPTGGGALTPFGGAAVYVLNSNNGAPYVYVASGRLNFALNSEDAGAYITP
jgi:hypothetical protein